MKLLNIKSDFKLWAFTSALSFVTLACGLGDQATSQVVGSEAPTVVYTAVEEIIETKIPLESSVLFQDDFQDGQAENWKTMASWFVQQSGDIYTFGAVGRGGSWVSEGYNWQDYVFQADTMLTNGSLILSFDFTDAGRYLLVQREDGLFLVKEQPPGKFNVVAQTGSSTPGVWHKSAIHNIGGHIQVYIDGGLWIDYSDPLPLVKGTIGVGTLDGSQAMVDNILVSKITGPLPSVPVVAPPAVADIESIELELEDIADVIPIDEIEPLPEPELAPPQEPQAVDQEQLPQVVPEVKQPDLTLSSPVIEPSNAESGQRLKITIIAQNQGSAQAGAFTINWYPTNAQIVGCSWDINQLAVGTAKKVSCDFPGYPQ